MKAKIILASLVLMATAVPLFAGSNTHKQSSVSSTISAQADPVSDSPSAAPATLGIAPGEAVIPATHPVVQPSPSPVPSSTMQQAVEPEAPAEQPAPLTIDHCESRHELTGKADPKYEVWYDCYMSDGSVDQQLKGYSNSKAISATP